MAATSNNTKKTKPDFARAIATSVAGPNQKEHAAPEPAEEKRTAGRPSSGRTIKITLAIPEDLMDGIEAASLLHKGNRTAYINSLIRKDLSENLTKYTEFRNMINR